MMKKVILLLGLLAAPFAALSAPIEVKSPDEKLTVRLEKDKALSLEVHDLNGRLYRIDDMAMHTDRGILPAPDAKIKKNTHQHIRREVTPLIKEKSAVIRDHYNQAKIDFRDGVSIEIRAYNDGVAYRFITNFKEGFTVARETGAYTFADKGRFTFQRDHSPAGSCEMPYVTTTIGALTREDMGNLPALVQIPDSKRLLFLEADVQDYPIMWLKTENGKLNAHHWPYPATYHGDNYYNRRSVQTSHDYIARVEGKRTFPWRAMAIADHDYELMTNELVYLLAPECRIENPSWIKPGWVIFDWWSKMGVFGVDFKAGMNTETAKYMIDFAADFGMPYFLFDDGWTKEDLLKPVPAVSIEEVVAHGRKKGVGVMLWVSYAQLYDQMDEAFEQFEKWGIQGIKIDFMNRFDQEIVRFYWEVAEKAARHKLVVNFHGAYNPDGMRRAYPNVLTREALIEFEYNGWTDFVTPGHDCTLPFIRNVAGPMDYIPGTMLNGTKSKFRAVGETPMNQGTRAHSMAMAVISYSPMQMIPDSPSVYYKEEECARFLLDIPVEWDETLPINGTLGEQVTVARRNGNEWYLGGITNWDARKSSVPLHFLEEGREYTVELFEDGVNADMTATDYKRRTFNVRKGDLLDIQMAPGGGFVARFY